MRKFLFALFFLAFTTLLHSQPWAYDFGTGTGTANNTNSGTGLTTFFSTTVSPATATPTNGGTYRVRIGTAGGSLVVANPGTSLGSQSEVQLTAATSTSTNKFGVYDWSSVSTVGYVKFKLRTTSAGNGNLNFSYGINTLASDNQGFTIHYNNSLVSIRINYSGGSISSVQRRTSGTDNTISSSGISKDTDQLIEIYANNGSSSSNYFRGSVQYTLATQTWDMWVDGTRVVTGAAKAGTLASAINLSGFCFFAESSTSNAGIIYLDDLEYSNSLPSTAFSLTSDYFRSKATGNWSSTSTWESSSDNNTWINATLTPDNNANTISILAGHTVTLDANTSVSNTTIAATGALNVAPGIVLTVPLGKTLTTNNKLTLQSSNSGTASIGNSAGTITGNVTVERYIPAGKRGFRFLTPSVTTTTSIKANWQEGATSNTANPNAGYGTHITGSTTDQTNGFDGTTTGNPSLFQFNNATQAWNNGISNTDVNTLSVGNAYRLLIRGDRSFDLSSTSTTNTATTLRATGTVLTGDVTFNSTGTGATAGVPLLGANASDFSLVGNPYPSAVKWDAVKLASTDITGYYYIWDPTVATRGAYVSCFTDGTKNNPLSAVTIDIQPGQAFFVQNASSLTSGPVLLFKEAHKSAVSTNVFRTQTAASTLSAQLFLANNLAAGVPQDGTIVLFNGSYSNAVNDDDARKMVNPDENIAIVRNNTLMSIERRTLNTLSNDTVQFKLWQLTNNNYTLRLNAANFDNNVNAYLQDKYLGIETPVNLAGITDVNFTTSADAASTAADRFQLVFRSSNALPATFLSFSAAQKNGGIEVTWNTANEVNMSSYEVEESVDGINFTKATTVAAKNAASNNYNWLDANVINGDNFYRIKSVEQNGAFKYSNVVKVKVGGKNTEFTVYPNPVKGGVVNLQMSNVEKGIYTVKIFNQIGQELANKTINHNGGSATQMIDLGKTVAAGSYSMQISNGTTVITKTVIVE